MIFCEKNKCITKRFPDLPEAFCTADVLLHILHSPTMKIYWKLLGKNIPYAGAIPGLDQLHKKTTYQTFKVIWDCFYTVSIQRLLDLLGKKKTNPKTKTTPHAQSISLRIFLMYNQIKIKLNLECYFLFYILCVHGYVYRKNVSAFSRFIPWIISRNICW